MGEACGRLLAATYNEYTSVAFVYDITNLASPTLFKVFELAPTLQYESPGVSYNKGTIGDVDLATVIFLSASESQSGMTSIMFPGNQSGTVSAWEFECAIYDKPDESSSTITRSATFISSMWELLLWGVQVLLL